MQKIFEDKDLGKVVLKKYRNSRQYTIRIRSGVVSVSLPLLGSYKKAIELLETHRFKLLSMLKASPPKPAISEQDLKILRKEAKEYLPDRLQVLAGMHGFTYGSIRIAKSKSRWGSCSSKKNISLSLFLMQLPSHLIDYVILHELCHTVEMNHSPKFWELLDKVCDEKAKALRKELKTFHAK